MIISEFPEMNTEFGKPEGMEHSECQSLPAFQADNPPLTISCWKFTDNEMLLTLLEKKMWLWIYLPFQPVVNLMPSYPFLQPNGSYENTEDAVNRLLERKVNQFLFKKLDETKDVPEALELSKDYLKPLLKEFAHFIVETKPQS